MSALSLYGPSEVTARLAAVYAGMAAATFAIPPANQAQADAWQAGYVAALVAVAASFGIRPAQVDIGLAIDANFYREICRMR